MANEGFTVACNAFHAPQRGRLEILENCLIRVGGDGRIFDVVRRYRADHATILRSADDDGTLVALADSQYLLPGMVDLHIHAPQWAQLGKALDAPLEEWLQKYTFPLEAKYADTAFARQVYGSLVENLLANGTTTAVYFGTIHVEANLALAEICLKRGQRALVGKVAMDDPEQCPDFYRDADASAAVEDTKRFIQRLAEMQSEGRTLVHPAITPRFVPSCTDALLEGLGRVAHETGCHVQTHCCESDWASEHVQNRFGQTDTEVLARFGLLTDKTILAHSNFVSPKDVDRIKAAGSGVAHCPLSNFYFADAVFPLRAALDKGVNVGLGTDISGGYSPSLFDSARLAMIAARALNSGVDPAATREARGVPGSRITTAEAFWLATSGGGEALGLPVGVFAPGFEFDALVVDVDAPASNISLWPELESAVDVFDKIVLNAGRANIAAVWVGGKIRSCTTAFMPGLS
jgi:guanine deaminase